MEAKGDALMEEGEKILKKFSFFGSDDKSDRAREKFQQAATIFKANESFEKAAQAYCRCQDLSLKNKNEGEAVVDMEEAARCYTKANNKEAALGLYKKAVAIYEKNQKYTNAAKVAIAISDVAPNKEAAKWLDNASKYYKSAGSKVSSYELIIKMANLKERMGDYQEARTIYEQQAREVLDDRAMRGGARKLFFSALLCQIACMQTPSLMEDVNLLQETFQHYQELDTQFNELTQEHILIASLIRALEEQSLEMYDSAVVQYDTICPLDEHKEKMLLRGKMALQSKLEDVR